MYQLIFTHSLHFTYPVPDVLHYTPLKFFNVTALFPINKNKNHLQRAYSAIHTLASLWRKLQRRSLSRFHSKFWCLFINLQPGLRSAIVFFILSPKYKNILNKSIAAWKIPTNITDFISLSQNYVPRYHVCCEIVSGCLFLKTITKRHQYSVLFGIFGFGLGFLPTAPPHPKLFYKDIMFSKTIKPFLGVEKAVIRFLKIFTRN